MTSILPPGAPQNAERSDDAEVLGNPETATERIHAALAANDWATVTAVISDHWSSLLRNSREVTRAAVNALPDSVLLAQPRWAAAREYLNFATNGEGRHPMKFAHESFEPDWAPELMDELADLTSRSAAERSHGRFDAAAEVARAAIQVAAEAPGDELSRVRPIIADLRVQWAISLLLAGALREATCAFETAYDDATSFDNPRMATEAAGSIAFILSINGDLASARTWLQRQPAQNDAAAMQSPDDSTTVMGHLAAANIAIDELDAHVAREALARDVGDELAPEQWALRRYVQSRLEVFFGDPYAQLLRNRAAETARVPYLSQGGGLNEWALRFAESAILLAANEVGLAVDAVAALDTVHASPAAASAQIFQVWMLLKSRNDARALAVADEELARAGSLRTSAEMLAATVVGHLHSGDVERARQLFGTLMTLSSEQRMRSILTRFGASELDLLTQRGGIGLEDGCRERLAEVNERMFDRVPDIQLTDRERVVLGHLIGSLTLEQIAAVEHVSRNTIKSQTRSLFRKLGVGSRDEAVQVAVQHPALWRVHGL